MGQPLIQNTKAGKPGPLRCIVYGETKVGKTTFAGTFPKPFFFAMGNEAGIASLSQLPTGADYTLINSTDDMDNAVRYFKDHYKEIDPVDGKQKWRTAVVDTATIYARMVTMVESEYGTTAVEYHKWNKILGYFLNIRDVLHACDVHVVWVMHTDDQMLGDVVLKRRPKLVGAARGEIMATCGLIAYLDKKEEMGVDANGKPEMKTTRYLWVQCPQGVSPVFEVGSWYDQVWDRPCYVPHFDVLAKRLAPPAPERQHITI
jgi:hypothetical protein